MPRIFLLSEAAPGQVRRFISELGQITLADGQTSSWVTVTRTGSFTDPRYGRFEISRDLLLQMVRNFEQGTYGQDIFLDVSHRPDQGAAAKILRLTVEGNRLRALVEWTPYGIDAVKLRGMQYLSAEFSENFKDNEAGQTHGAVLLGAGLTVRPVIKGLDPIQLSCAADAANALPIPTYFHAELIRSLTEDSNMNKQQLLARLRATLAKKQLAEGNIEALLKAAALALPDDADDAACNKVLAEMETIAGQLQAGGTIHLSIASPAGLSTEDVRRLLTEEREASAARDKQLAETREGHLKLLAETITAASGIDDDLKKELSEGAAALITADWSEASVKQLAAQQIKIGQRLTASKKLAGMGYVAGSTQLQVVDEGARRLSGIYREHLGRANAGLALTEKPSPFVERVLAEFDRRHAASIDHEVKALAGETAMGSVDLPIGFQRQVITEALSDLNVLQLVQTLTDFSTTTTTQIPYEKRDTSAVLNNGIVYEGQGIPRAGVSQFMDTAHLTPMKLALLISNEVAYLTRASAMNWDALARNLASNARLMRELVVRRICNELQRAADSYLAAPVSNEAISAQLTGANSLIKLAKFPLVRPHLARDMQGNPLGVEENPLTLTIHSAAVLPFDGSGEQAAGIYYRVLNYNLGYLQLVDQTGQPTAPANTGTNTVSYSYATNVIAVDADVPNGIEPEKHLNKLVQAVGRAKARLSQERLVLPDYALGSPLLLDTVSNAEQFTQAGRRDGSNTDASGAISSIKNLPAFDTNAAGIDLGEERLLIGQRGQLGYTVAKPFETQPLFEAVDSRGRPVGQKQTYGEEYNAIHVPKPVRDRHISVLYYSFTNR